MADMIEGVKIIEKPECISWKEISLVLQQAHQQNRDEGIIMRYPFLSPSQLQDKLEERNGKLFVAILNDRIVGLGAVSIIRRNLFWCGTGLYAYSFLDAVLPEYAGHGIFHKIEEVQERYALSNDVYRMLMDTHERNKSMLRAAQKIGYRKVDYRVWEDHHSIILVKWLEGSPYSRLWCSIKFIHKRWKRQH